MNIWLINHYAVPPQYYPLTRQACFAKYLLRAGHSVTIFAASTVHNSSLNLITDGRKTREETVDGVRYVYIRCRGYQGNGLSRIVNMCEFALKLPGVCSRYSKPDAIVATCVPPTACAMGIRLARKYRCRGVAEIADLWPESIVAYGIAGAKHPAVLVLRRLEKWIYTHADSIVFTMEGAYDYIRERGWERAVPERKVHYINNGVDLEDFDENLARYRLDDEDLDDPESFKVVYTGSIRRVNNLGRLLDAAKQIHHKRIRFLIWGDGDERELLERRVRDEKIRNVVFKGRVEKKYIPGILSRADLNIAHNDASPLFRFGISFNKIFDYLAAGKPILCDFPCAYNPVVTSGAGFGLADPTAESIAARIEELAGTEPSALSQLGRRARAAAERKYNYERLTQELIGLLRQ